jgi:hypothetical protein
LRVGHERGLFVAHVARERRVELLPVEKQKPVLWRQNRRLGPVRWETPDQGVHRLVLVRHEGSDVDERRNLGMVSRLGDDRPAVGVADEDDRFALRVDCALGHGDVVGVRDRRVLHDGDGVAVVS